jgi:hypothetical protein
VIRLPPCLDLPSRLFARGSRCASLPRTALACVSLSFLCVAALANSATPPAAPETQQAPAGAVSVAAFQSRLQSLDQLIVSCQTAMTPANCLSDKVGPDLKLALPSGTRQVRLAWLRAVLDAATKDQATKDLAAQHKTTSAPKAASPAQPAPTAQPEFHPPTLVQQLEDARQRLAAESASAGEVAGQPPGQLSGQASGNPASNQLAKSTPARQALARILAAGEYHVAAARPSLQRRILEKIGNWLNRIIAKLQQAGFRSRWVGLTAEIGFGLLVCLALAWFLIRLERRGRLGTTAFALDSASGAASARDWQLWLADAGKAADQGAWRDAIHFLYWASISRLESGGLWPADRARTPREYLALLAGQSPQRTELAALTRSFERTWYAGRPAAEADYHQAEQVAARLGARPNARPDTRSARTNARDEENAP